MIPLPMTDKAPALEYSPEPWLALPGSPQAMHHIQTASGEHIATFSKRKDMERTVVCVNACAGVTTEDMERLAKLKFGGCGGVTLLAARLDEVSEQRDELAEALREMGDWLAYGLDKPNGAKPTAADLRRAQEVAAKGRAALAKVAA